MDPSQLAALRSAVVAVVGECREHVLAGISELEITTKSEPWDIVTTADRTAEQFLRERLAALLPDAAFVGEESAAQAPTAGLWWLVDPIDGTSNFVHGLAPAMISVALMFESAPVLGVLTEIFGGDVYQASREGGAFFASGPPASVTSKLNGPTRQTLHECLVGVGFPYDHDHDALMFAVARALHGSVQDLRRSGSAAADVCRVAHGLTDAYVELDVRPWDIAAAAVVAAESGAVLVDWEGAPLSWHDPLAYLTVAVSGPTISRELVAIIRGAMSDHADSSAP